MFFRFKLALFSILSITFAPHAAATLITFNDEMLDPSLIATATNFSFNVSTAQAGEFALAFDDAANTFGDQSTVNTSNFSGGQLRQITTNGLDFSGGGSVSFDLLIGNSSTTDFGFFENADTSSTRTTPSGLQITGEDIGLFFSVDGGATFALAQLFDTEAPETLGQFANFNVVLPTAAQTSNTVLQILQVFNSGNSFDHFAIDNFSVDAGQSTPVPAPATVILFALGAAGLMVSRKRSL